MSVSFWTIVLCAMFFMTILPAVMQAYHRGPKQLQQLGSIMFDGFYRTSGVYIVVASITYWLGLSFLTGFQVGLGVGVSTSVTTLQMGFYVVDWMLVVLVVVVVVGGRFRLTHFRWVFPPYSEQLVRIWIFRAHVWNRSREGLRRFLLKYRNELEEHNTHFEQAFTMLSARQDWIGEISREVEDQVRRESAS